MKRAGEIRWRVPGGKAAARLRQFRRERGLSGGPGTGETSAYYDALKLRSAQVARLDATQPQPRWSPMGPFSIPHGQTYGAAQPAVSGRVSCVAIDPGAAKHLLVGSASGGLWESFDDGQSWTPARATNGEFPMTLGAIAFAPGDNRTVLAGSGEGNAMSDYGAGLWKSTDGGSVWSVLAESPFIGVGFYKLVIDPLNPQHMLAATTGGLFHSQDGGAHWGLAAMGPPGRLEMLCWDVSMHPAVAGAANSTREIFACAPDGLYQSPDGGDTWNQVLLTGAPNQFQRIAVCHDPAQGDVVYVFGQDTYGLPALWRRSAAGSRFLPVFCPRGIDLSQSWYDWYIAVSPASPNVVYAGAISLWKGELSGQGTWNWSNISSRGYGDGIHPDQHAIAFSPSNPDCIYAGSDGGLFRSPDGGVTWEPLNKGLAITQFEYVAQHPTQAAWFLGGTQDNGTLRYHGSEAWYQVALGDGGECGVNQFAPYIAYHCYYNMNVERSITGAGAGSWTDISPSVPANYSSLFYPPMDVDGTVIVIAGEDCRVSTDTGTTFTEVDLPADAGVATAIEIQGLFRFYVATESGDIYRFDWTSDGWAAPETLTQPRSGYISSIRAERGPAGRLWVTYSDGGGPNIYRSDNSGDKWKACVTGLPGAPVNIVEFDSSNPDTVFAGTDAGVWRSDDGGRSWTVFSNGLPNAIVGDLLFSPATRLLRAGTQSRGVWEVDLSGAREPDPHVFIRRSTVDTGRNPCADGVDDPFSPGEAASWQDSPDILVDSRPYSVAEMGDMDFVSFEDARQSDAKTARGHSRIYVQVHQRGTVAAQNAIVRLFFADATPSDIPALPQGFWEGFGASALPAGSAWTSVGAPAPLAGLTTGKPQVAGFEWHVPDELAGKSVWLLAIVMAANDSLAGAELDLTRLIPQQTKCALKRAQA